MEKSTNLSVQPGKGLQKNFSTPSKLPTTSVSLLPGDHSTTSLFHSSLYQDSTVAATGRTTIKLELGPKARSDFNHFLHQVPFRTRLRWLPIHYIWFLSLATHKRGAPIDLLKERVEGSNLLVAYVDGRLDVCLDPIKVKAIWIQPVSSTFCLSIL